MSGIYIPGMEMPKNCGECLFWEPNNFKADCLASDEVVLCRYGGLPDDCPLIPIPDHGRLIDADALDADLERQDMRTGEYDSIGFSIHEIDNAPTIIPADQCNNFL